MWFDASTAEIGDTLYLASPLGWSSYTVTEWTITRKTKSGQIVCRRGEREMRLTAQGRIIGAGTWSRDYFVTAEEAAQLRAERAEQERFRNIETLAEAVRKAAHNQDAEALRDAFASLAQGIEAEGGDAASGSVHESPVGAAEAPAPSTGDAP